MTSMKVMLLQFSMNHVWLKDLFRKTFVVENKSITINMDDSPAKQ